MQTAGTQRPIVVALGLYIPGTGFTRVFDTLLRILGKDFEIHWIGIAYKGPVTKIGQYTLHPNNLRGGDIFGAYGSAHLAKELNAHIVLFINDVWMLKNYRDTHAGQKWKTIAYVPLDGDIIHTHDIIDLAFLDALIAYHGESTNQFSLALNNLYKSKLIDHIPSLQSIYHGVDTGIFNIDDIHQNAWRLHAKHILFNHLDRWESSIIVLNANRFNERKDLYTTLAGFSEARNHTDRHLYLCMHMPAIEPFQLDILNGWISTLNLDDHIIINPLGNGKFVSDEKLCLLYRACEIGVNTSLGEGWGLVSFEHAACGAIQILPRHAGLEEIWKDNAEYIEIEENIKLPSNPFMMHRASASHLATILANLCNNPDYLQARSKASFDHVNGDEFDWVVIAKKWQSLLMEYC